jgi:hypothetical protein
MNVKSKEDKFVLGKVKEVCEEIEMGVDNLMELLRWGI